LKRYYFDHSATTRVNARAIEAMTRVMESNFGNPSSVHAFGRDARVVLEEYRETIASLLNADAGEVFFTSGGTEADNLALIGVMQANRSRGRHLITSAYEHHAILDAAEYLGKNGFEISYIKPDRYGQIQLDDVVRAIRPDTQLISVMHVNNEVGTINDIGAIGKLAQERDILFHTDAVQSFSKIPIDVKAMNIDLLSLSGHKIYGPKGNGAIYIRKGVNIERRQFGGHQEREIRTGTENLPGIAGLTMAAQICHQEMDSEAERLLYLREKLWNGLNDSLADIQLNGHPEERLHGLCNVSFGGVEGEALMLSMDLKGIAASTGSACSSGQTSASHVLLSMGIPPEMAQSSIRFSLGKETDDEAVDYVLEIVPEIVNNLRKMSF